jgi:hypothetical protein
MVAPERTVSNVLGQVVETVAVPAARVGAGRAGAVAATILAWRVWA